jgi:hypothetical protein
VIFPGLPLATLDFSPPRILPFACFPLICLSCESQDPLSGVAVKISAPLLSLVIWLVKTMIDGAIWP